MHPIERLRYVARASGADQTLLVRETAQALAAFRNDPAGLVAACRRIVDRHPTSAPLWWLCARVLTSPDGQREAWDAVDEIEGDSHAGRARVRPAGRRHHLRHRLARARRATPCPVEATSRCWPSTRSARAVAWCAASSTPGSTPSTCRRQGSAPRSPLPDVLLLEAVALGPTGFVGVSGSLAAATVARHAERARVAGRRRRSAPPRPHVGRPVGATRGRPRPTRGTSTKRSCRSRSSTGCAGPAASRRPPTPCDEPTARSPRSCSTPGTPPAPTRGSQHGLDKRTCPAATRSACPTPRSRSSSPAVTR